MAEKIASAYPDLTKLQLSSGTQLHRKQPRLTLVALRAFVEHCPRLHRLDLELDARTVPSEDVNADSDVRVNKFPIHSPSIHLNVGFSPIRDPDAVARFLFGLFWETDEIHTWDEWETPIIDDEDDDSSLVLVRRYHKRWMKASGIVSRMAREAGRPGLWDSD
ncbi:hypothetical protein C8F01DRAFT_1293040 [Mycena amicta]|nr:hypothetical protein C8F01DRAFT_1293040 [Mycena amicta]